MILSRLLFVKSSMYYVHMYMQVCVYVCICIGMYVLFIYNSIVATFLPDWLVRHSVLRGMVKYKISRV